MRKFKFGKYCISKGISASGVLFLCLLIGLTACGSGEVTPNTVVEAPLPSSSAANQSSPLFSATGGTRTSVSQGTAETGPAKKVSSVNFEHVFIIVLENAGYDDAMKQPFLSQFARSGVLLTNYRAVSHPSFPNYLAFAGGSTFGINNDDDATFDKTNLVDLMENAGVSWKVYAEQLPSKPCAGDSRSGGYVRKHEPFISFLNVQNNPKRCANIVNSNQLSADVAAGKLANYSLYVPDLNNDGHDTGAAFASNWLQSFLSPLIQNSNFSRNTLIAVTFDEAENYNVVNQVYTVLAGETVQSGITSNIAYTHYDLLRTIEDNFGLGNLGREDSKASGFSGIWKNRG